MSPFFNAFEGGDTTNIPTSSLKPFLYWNIPARSDDFVGRLEQLGEIQEKYAKKYTTTVITQSIIGLGGIGKTTLAIEFANNAKDKKVYDCVIWLNAETDLSSEFKRLAEELKLDCSRIELIDIIKIIYNHLCFYNNILLVFDNVSNYEAVRDYLDLVKEYNKIHILITSRHQAWGRHIPCIRLKQYSEKEAKDYIEKALPQENSFWGEKIAKTLFYFPLALTQAASYIEQTKTTIEAYLKIYKNQKPALLNYPPFPDDHYTKTVYDTWDISMQKINAENPGAREILDTCAYLVPDIIDRQLLADITQLDSFSINQNIEVLLNYSLIEVNEKNRSVIRIHRLVQEVIRLRLFEQQKSLIKNLTLNKVLSKFLNKLQVVITHNSDRLGRSTAEFGEVVQISVADTQHYIHVVRTDIRFINCSAEEKEKANKILDFYSKVFEALYHQLSQLVKPKNFSGPNTLEAIYPSKSSIESNEVEVDWLDHRLFFEQAKLSEDAEVSLAFQKLLIAIKDYNQQKYYPNSISCFISYAWPSKENPHEEWIINFLPVFANHLRAAGIIVHLDLQIDTLRTSIEENLKLIAVSDFFLLMGTHSLSKRYELGETSIAHELNMINMSLSSNKKSHAQIIPILLTGTFDTSFPIQFRTYSDIEEFRGHSYLYNLISLIQHLYQIDKDEKFNNLIWGFQDKYPEYAYGLTKVQVLSLLSQQKNLNTNVMSDHQLPLLKESKILLSQEKRKPINSNIPRPANYSVYRKFILGQIDQVFQTSKKEVMEKSVQLLGLIGMGGIGKTQVAIQYAHLNQNKSQICWLFRAESIGTLQESYMELGDALGIIKKHKDSVNNIIYQVKIWLEHHPNWLLIYDNAGSYEVLKPYLPVKGGRILITSRKKNWPVNQIYLHEFSEQEATAYIEQNLDSFSGTTAKGLELAKRLGYLPLALAQACAFIKQSGMSISDYLELFAHDSKMMLSVMPQSVEYQLNVNANYLLAIENLAKQDSLVKILLSFFAYLAPDNIPRVLLNYYPFKQSITGLALDNAIAILLSNSLISINQSSIQIHRLLQEVIINQQTEYEKRENLVNALEALQKAYSANNDIHVKVSLINHIEKAYSYYRELDFNEQYNRLIAPLLKDLINFYSISNVSIEKARYYFELALPIYERLYIDDSEKLAELYQAIGDNAQVLMNPLETKNPRLASYSYNFFKIQNHLAIERQEVKFSKPTILQEIGKSLNLKEILEISRQEYEDKLEKEQNRIKENYDKFINEKQVTIKLKPNDSQLEELIAFSEEDEQEEMVDSESEEFSEISEEEYYTPLSSLSSSPK